MLNHFIYYDGHNHHALLSASADAVLQLLFADGRLVAHLSSVITASLRKHLAGKFLDSMSIMIRYGIPYW